jgi:Helix-turn-helix domain
MAHPPARKWLTVAEVAAMLGTSTETIRRRITVGELPASRASTAPHAAWLIDAAEFERQREADAERAAIRRRLGGVVVGRGDEFAKKPAQHCPDARVGSPEGPTLADHTRAMIARHETFERLQRDMAADPGLREQFEALDEANRFEAEARELARRVRRSERLRDRVWEILDEEDQDEVMSE